MFEAGDTLQLEDSNMQNLFHSHGMVVVVKRLYKN